MYGWGLFIGEPEALQLPSRCRLGAGGVCAFNACNGDCDAKTVLTGDAAAELVVLTALKFAVVFVKPENIPGSYLSLMFSSRLRSSSKIDFRESTDFTMSDGGTSCTSSSRSLCRNDDVDEDETLESGD